VNGNTPCHPLRPSPTPTAQRHPGPAGRGTAAQDVAVFVVTGGSEEEIGEKREKMRSQIAFYASTPTYRTVLEAHGWEEVGKQLTGLAGNKRWDEMPKLVKSPERTLQGGLDLFPSHLFHSPSLSTASNCTPFALLRTWTSLCLRSASRFRALRLPVVA
jgi:hypothetical protein